MLIKISAKELKRAMKDMQIAEKNGFMFCEAVFEGYKEDETWTQGKYRELLEKAHPTDGTLNWGRGQNVTKRNTFKDGKLIPTKKTLEEVENYPASKAIESGEINGHKYWIVPAPVDDTLNGYICFPKRPTVEREYRNILTYVPVHGGITYAEQKKMGMIYGFDTGHCDSEKYPRNDKKWIKKQIRKMLKGILMAAKVEEKYLLAKTDKEKAKYAQLVLDTDKEKENQYNFGIGINVLTGEF